MGPIASDTMRRDEKAGLRRPRSCSGLRNELTDVAILTSATAIFLRDKDYLLEEMVAHTNS